MKIFLIKTDVNHFRYFLPEDDADALVLLNLDGTPKGEAWSPPRVRNFQAQA